MFGSNYNISMFILAAECIYIYDVYCIRRRQYQRFLDILFRDVSVAQLVASMSGVVLGGVVMVVGSSLAIGKIFTASIDLVDSLYISLSIFRVQYIEYQLHTPAPTRETIHHV